MEVIRQFPHCDSRVLHSKGICEYCDKHPDWQELRKAWHIGFTGEQHADDWLPCPADFARPANSQSDHRRWAGNVATSQEPVNETTASKAMYGDLSADKIVYSDLTLSPNDMDTVAQATKPRRRFRLRRNKTK